MTITSINTFFVFAIHDYSNKNEHVNNKHLLQAALLTKNSCFLTHINHLICVHRINAICDNLLTFLTAVC